jgi:hypothetical protein
MADRRLRRATAPVGGYWPMHRPSNSLIRRQSTAKASVGVTVWGGLMRPDLSGVASGSN